jgi:phospholipase/lecithinase/hemolysin
VVKAVSWENYPVELGTRAVMQRVAAAHSVPIVDAHRHLYEYRSKGFLWWDFVHPTSFGHRLIADCIYAEMRKQLPSEWFAEVAPMRP